MISLPRMKNQQRITLFRFKVSELKKAVKPDKL